jgi:hypothetical protein
MAGGNRRKCKCCLALFRPDLRNRQVQSKSQSGLKRPIRASFSRRTMLHGRGARRLWASLAASVG